MWIIYTSYIVSLRQTSLIGKIKDFTMVLSHFHKRIKYTRHNYLRNKHGTK